MPKESRIAITIPLDGDEFQQAETMVKIRPLLEKLGKDVAALNGSVEHQVVQAREPSATPRKSRRAAPTLVSAA